jgi:CRP-like cAMP-binding protein
MKEDTPAFVADADLMAALEACGQLHCCKSEETLFRQGELPEALYLLQKGQVTLTAHSAEKECVFARQALRGSVFGLPGVISNTPYSLTARARAGSQLRVISRHAFHQMLSLNPEMSFHALRILAAEVQAARRILHDEEETQRTTRHPRPRGEQSRKSGNSDRITS